MKLLYCHVSAHFPSKSFGNCFIPVRDRQIEYMSVPSGLMHELGKNCCCLRAVAINLTGNVHNSSLNFTHDVAPIRC